ncbi:MAG: twin-arginine translocase subunit TatC, partial [Desulfovibrionaceae bacterium]|nr:twin-arginine translocase subunit TatC [Desulfovibrionaceae bacterium]
EEADGEGGRMSLMDHLRELRRRLLFSLAAAFVGFLVCWSFVEPIFNVLTEPLLAVLPEGSSAMYTTLPEAFFTRMYIAFIVGLFLASPYIFYQVWAFISPGLYDEEKHFIIPVAVVSAVFFVAGGLFCYYIVFRYAFSFFMSFTTVDIVAMPKISDYLDFVLKLLLAFGLIFEMPIFAFFLSRMGVVTAAKMRSFRRYSVLLIFIVAAILTPPDVVSQLLMAVPMLLLYEVSILVAAIFGKKPAPESGPDDDPDGGADDEDSGNDGEDGGNGPAPSGGAGGLAAAAAAAAAPRVVKPVPIVPDQPELHPERLHGAAPEAGEKAAEAEPDAGAKKAAGEEKDSADAGSAEGESPAEPERYAPWDPRGELEPRENMDFEALVAAEKAAEDAGRNDNADRSVQEEPVPTTEKKQ